jgi:[FeFe] hydrogenase (group B1/B3)
MRADNMLTINNKNTYIRKELTSLLLRHFFQGTLEENIDRIPVDLYPKKNSSYRCCTFKDRAMTRYRIMALLGISIEKDDDEYKPLSGFLSDALNRKKIEEPVLTVSEIACSSCPKVAYTVTGECRGCLARPCQTNCPFDAITISNGKALINKELCRNCGKCEELCPFNAIIYTPVPCEENCPVGAVKRDENGSMFIDYDNCIFCGRCSRSCPFGAVLERSQIIDVAAKLLDGHKVTALLAPSVIGQFPGSLGQLSTAIKEAGFSAVLDVSAGADKTAALEALEFTERINRGESLMGTSCCPAWVKTVEKHLPQFKPFVSDTHTPMYYTAETAGELFPDSVKVFIGPCTAKKSEALRDNSVDYVLSFEELGALFIARDIDVNECSESAFDNGTASFQAKAFAASGGVTEAVRHNLDNEAKKIYNPLSIDGLSKKNINLIKAAAAGKLKQNMIEVMSCEGGCICGPGVISNPKIAKKKLDSFLDIAG